MVNDNLHVRMVRRAYLDHAVRYAYEIQLQNEKSRKEKQKKTTMKYNGTSL